MEIEDDNREKEKKKKKKQMAKKRVGGKKRKRIIGTDHHHHDDVDEKRPWSDLPNELLEMIKKRLFFIDQVNFRSVCKSWSRIERIPPLQQMPWLLLFDEDNNNSNSCKLVDSKDKKTYTADAKTIKDKLKITYFSSMKVHESKYGWLLVSNYCNRHSETTLICYSPFFDEEKYNFIESPVLKCEITLATFTSNPLDEDCEILTLYLNYSDNTLLINTFRRGQSSWRSRIFGCDFEPWNVRSWMYSEGNFYYVTRDRTVGKFNLALEEWNAFPPLPSTLQGLSNLVPYIVRSSDGVIFLILILERNSKRIYDIWHYYSHIYRLHLSSMSWEDLDSIDDRVLFIGDGYNSVLNSSVLKLNGERKDISDKIYWCTNNELRYCSVHDYTVKIKYGTPRKLDCSRHYGLIAKKRCKKMLIDPPPL